MKLDDILKTHGLISANGKDDKTGSPGSDKLIAGDMTAGYFGVVPASELFTGLEIASACVITQGTAQFSDSGWLKFAIDGKIIFKSKKTIRHSISRTYIGNKGCSDGTTQVAKDGITYKVRLMKTGAVDPMAYFTGKHLFGSEWNRLMYPIHINAKTDSGWRVVNNVEKPTQYWGIDFTDTDLQTGVVAGNGSFHWCQELYTYNGVTRGGNGVSRSDEHSITTTNNEVGWSPVLEVVE